MCRVLPAVGTRTVTTCASAMRAQPIDPAADAPTIREIVPAQERAFNRRGVKSVIALFIEGAEFMTGRPLQERGRGSTSADSRVLPQPGIAPDHRQDHNRRGGVCNAKNRDCVHS